MKYAFLLAGCLTTSAMSTAAHAQSFGDWGVSARQGYQEHIVSNGPGNSFNISCDFGAAADNEPKNTTIFIEIAGKEPPPKSLVEIFVIDDIYKFPTDERGTIRTDCRVCADNFVALWQKLRKSSAMVVRYPDGRSVSFKTRGATKALAPKPCKTGFDP